MSRHPMLLASIVLHLCVFPISAGEPDAKPGIRGAEAGVGGPPIFNKVLDLLNHDIAFDADGGTESWTSSPFATSQVNRVILKTASEIDNGFLRCYLEWQFTSDDAFEASGSSVGVIGDDVNPRLIFPTGVVSYGVYGMRARVRCDLLSLPDFGSSNPPPPATGTLTDVKVLLRTE